MEIRHGAYYTPIKAAAGFRAAWNSAYKDAHQPNMQSPFTSMRAEVNYRNPKTLFEFRLKENSQESITFGQASSVVGEVHRQLRRTEWLINAISFIITRSGSSDVISAGKATGNPGFVSDFRFHDGAYQIGALFRRRRYEVESYDWCV